jgi:hypothetical protein
MAGRDFSAELFGDQQTGGRDLSSELFGTIEPTKKRGFGLQFLEDAKQTALAGLHGAAGIGATLISPVDALTGYKTRRADIESGLRDFGYDEKNWGGKGGKLAVELLGTAGMGGSLAKGAAMVPGVAKAAPAFLESLGSSGLSTAGKTGFDGIVTRAAGGAITGGASAALVNPDDAVIGAGIGAGLPVAGAITKGAGKVASSFFGASSGVGNDAIEAAFKTGAKGSANARDAFTQNMRGKVQIDDVLHTARENVSDLGKARQAAYQKDIAQLSNDSKVLQFGGIDSAMAKAMDMASFKGKIKNQPAADAVGKVASIVDEWKSLNPAEFHTPIGLDALKQRVYGVVESIPYEQKTARTAAMNIYHSIKSEINQQAPSYAKTMKDYSDASNLIKQIEKSVTGNDRTATDTAIRKLQSIMRNNANTSYGFRKELADKLEAGGRNEIIPALAGQALNSYMPRGIQRATASGGTGAMLWTGNVPAAAGMAAISSPRLVGEAAYKAGQIAVPLGGMKDALYPYLPVLGSGLLNDQ